MVKKAGKRIDGLLAQTTLLQQQTDALQQENNRLKKPKNRQAINTENRTDINVVFANKEAIHYDAAKQRHKRQKRTNTDKKKAAEAKAARKVARYTTKLLNLVQV